MDATDCPLQEKLDAFSSSVSSAVAPLWTLLLMLSKDQKAPLGDKLVPLISLLDQWPHRGLGGITDVLAWMEQTKQDLLDSYKSSPSRTPQCLEVHLLASDPILGFLRTLREGSGGSEVWMPPEEVVWDRLPILPLPTISPGLQAVPMAVLSGVLLAEFKLLQQQVADLQAQAATSTVVIGGQFFKSLTQVTSWMKLNAPTTGSHVAFLDASTSLLAIKPPP